MDPVSTPTSRLSLASGERAEASPDPRRLRQPLDTSVDARLRLQRRAGANLRHHVRRATTRFVVLLAGDLLAVAAMRTLLHLARDEQVLGSAVALGLAAIVPAGRLNGPGFAAALILGLVVARTYETGDHRRDPKRLFVGSALATALPLWAGLWTHGFAQVAAQYSLTVPLVWLGVLADRWVIDRLLRLWRRGDEHAAVTLFVGPRADYVRVSRTAPFAGGGDFAPAGFVDLDRPPAEDALGHVDDFAVVLARTRAQAVVLCGRLTDQQLRHVAEVASVAGCQLLSVPRALEADGLQPSVIWRQGEALIQLTEPMLRWQQLLVKRVVDLVGASVGLLLASPAMLAIAAAIKLDSPGPVFFRQERIGTGGRRFPVLKFRTMYEGVSDAAHRELVTKMLRGDEASAAQLGKDGKPAFKLVSDARVTRVGRWLRRRSLDELPQLFNVLRGEMSLVGPRPPVPYEFEQYEHWQFHRLQVRPGLTGLWQVSGRSRLSYREMCELDVRYVLNWSPWLDLKIMAKTVPVVLSNSGGAH